MDNDSEGESTGGTRPRRRRGCELTERDFKLVFTAAKFGLVRTQDFTRLYFTSKYTALHRLKRLVRAGYLVLVE